MAGRVNVNERSATNVMNEGMKYEGRNETLNSFISFNPVNVNETNGSKAP